MSLWTRALVAGYLLLSADVLPANAGCAPRDRRTLGWPRNTVVHFDISRLPRNVRGAARMAFEEWTLANRKAGNGVVFIEGLGPNRVIVRRARANRRPAQAQFQLNRLRQTRGEATIRIDLDNRNFFDPREDGYEAAVTKTVLHEIGHTMGLDDVDGSPCRQAKRRSVMNGLCETNDQRGTQPQSVTACDLDTLRELAAPPRRRTEP